MAQWIIIDGIVGCFVLVNPCHIGAAMVSEAVATDSQQRNQQPVRVCKWPSNRRYRLVAGSVRVVVCNDNNLCTIALENAVYKRVRYHQQMGGAGYHLRNQ